MVNIHKRDPYWFENYLFLEDGRVCRFTHQILGGRVFEAFDTNDYQLQLLLFRHGNPKSNIGIKAVGIASGNDHLLCQQRLWDKRYFEHTGKQYDDDVDPKFKLPAPPKKES